MSSIQSDKQLAAGDKQKAIKLAEEKILPYVDFEEATRLAVGRGWPQATPEQKKQLVQEFRNMLVRTYTKAFTVYRDQTVEVKPFKMAADATEATVKTTINKPGAPPVPVDYEMEKTAEGWKAYDVAIEGVSMVNSYRGTFATQIEQNGIDGLIKTLSDKNANAVNVPLHKAEKK